MRRALLAAAAALVLAGGCDGGGDDSAATGSTTTPTTSTTTTTVATTTTALATTTTAAGGGPCTTPEEATMSLHDAWANDDDGVPGPDAGRCATEVAIDTLFGAASGPSPTEMFMGCVDEVGLTRCGYYYEGGGISFLVNVADTGYVVENVEFIAD